jgi:hypothetical protein
VKTRILLSVVVALAIIVTGWLVAGYWLHTYCYSQSSALLSLSDVSCPTSAHVYAPLFFLSHGSLWVSVDGDLDGQAVLHLHSNQGRDYREFEVSGPDVELHCKESETWVDDLEVVYERVSVVSGELTIAVGCGVRSARWNL